MRSSGMLCRQQQPSLCSRHIGCNQLLLFCNALYRTVLFCAVLYCAVMSLMQPELDVVVREKLEGPTVPRRLMPQLLHAWGRVCRARRCAGRS